MNDHDKDMLAIDGEIFAKCFRLLGLDETGTDIQIIPVSIAALRAELAQKDEQIAELQGYIDEHNATVLAKVGK